jgi:hypothetical protein
MNSGNEMVELAAWGLYEIRDRDDGIAADSLTRLQYRLLRSNRRLPRTFCPSNSFSAGTGRHAAKWCR